MTSRPRRVASSETAPGWALPAGWALPGGLALSPAMARLGPGGLSAHTLTKLTLPLTSNEVNLVCAVTRMCGFARRHTLPLASASGE